MSILEQNQKDVQNARSNGMSPLRLQRLTGIVVSSAGGLFIMEYFPTSIAFAQFSCKIFLTGLHRILPDGT